MLFSIFVNAFIRGGLKSCKSVFHIKVENCLVIRVLAVEETRIVVSPGERAVLDSGNHIRQIVTGGRAEFDSHPVTSLKTGNSFRFQTIRGVNLLAQPVRPNRAILSPASATEIQDFVGFIIRLPQNYLQTRLYEESIIFRKKERNKEHVSLLFRKKIYYFVFL